MGGQSPSCGRVVMKNGYFCLSVVLCALPLLSQNAAPPRAEDAGGKDFTISADVELVILDVSVKDPKGGYVSGLTQENFRVFENKQAQPIKYFSHADIPVTVGLVLDNS